MNTIQWYDILRLGTSILAVTAMWLLGLSWLRRGKDFSTRLKDFWWATNAMLFFIAANTVEQVLRDRDATWTLPIGFCAAALRITAAAQKPSFTVR